MWSCQDPADISASSGVMMAPTCEPTGQGRMEWMPAPGAYAPARSAAPPETATAAAARRGGSTSMATAHATPQAGTPSTTTAAAAFRTLSRPDVILPTAHHARQGQGQALGQGQGQGARRGHAIMGRVVAVRSAAQAVVAPFSPQLQGAQQRV